MDPGPEAPPREFAAAFLGHSRDSHGELECNFRVTHLPSGVFWLVRRPLSEWQHLEERLLREAGRLPGPASARPSAGASRRSSGFFFRRSSDVSRKQLEALQAQLAVILSDSELRDSTVLQDFLGVPAQAPEMPSSVRIVNLRRCQDGEAEVQLEVQTTPEKALVEGRTSATHVVATVLLLRPRGADEELEEIGDFKVPAGSHEPLTIHGLEADRAYEFQVKTVNDVGSSPSVRIRVLVPTDLPEPVQPHQGSSEVPSTAVPHGAADFLGNVPAANGDKAFASDASAEAPTSLHQEEAAMEDQASGEADKPALADAAVTGQETVLPAPLPAEVEADAVDTATVEMPAPETTAEASCSEPSAAKETPADGLASLQQQAVEGSKTAAIAESLSNGQPQKLDPARLKLKEGDPYLSPHARALVNDEEGATFLNSSEEVRSPQRESSARSLQPPSAGFARVGSLEVRLSQLPDKKAVGAAMDEAIAHLETYYKVSEQTALRLYLGCNLDMEEAKRRFDGILEWRKQYGVDQMRQGLLSALRAEEPVMVPFHKEVAKLVTINPCALTSAEGSPVSIYYVGTAHSSAAPKADEDQLRRFGVFVAEYVDVWLSAQTTTTGKLAGHVQIYDLQGLSLWQVSSGALVEKLKILLGAGQHYMEQVSHIFVIRSSSAFSMAWNFIKGWISPRTASKIHVSSSIPSELQKLLGPSAAALPALLKNPQWTAAVQRPPFTSEE